MESKALNTKQIAEVAILLAIAFVLEMLAWLLPKMPQGGSFSLSMLPIFIIAFRHGFKIGILAGVIYGLVDLMLNFFVLYHWASFFLDYVFAFGLLGVSAIIFNLNRNHVVYFGLGMLVGSLLRFFSHWLSGVLLFADWVKDDYPNVSVGVGSLIYNSIYMVPSIVVTLIVGVILYIRLKPTLLNKT